MSSYKYPATGGGAGDIVGPASATDNAVPRWNGTNGELLQDSLVTISDTGSISLPALQTVDGRDVSVDGSTLDTHVAATAAHGATGAVVGTTNSQTLTNKTIDADSNTITNIEDADIKAAAGIDATKIADGSVTNTEFQYISTLSSNAQTQLDAMVEKAGDTMSGRLNVDAGIDVTATVGTDTLSIGTTDADVINIGRSGATVNIIGTTAFQDVTNYQVEDKNITINKGGAAGSGTGAGIEVEEDGSATGYVQTSANRNSWEVKAPNTAGVATITPGASGITLDQSSHNPVTIGTANGLSLATQALSLQLATSGQNGALSSTDWTTFNSKLAIEGVVAVAGDVALTNRRLHFVDTSAARSLTLPAASTGLYLVVKDSVGSAQTNNITLVRPGTEEIEGAAASYVLDTNRGSWTIVSDGTNYFIT